MHPPQRQPLLPSITKQRERSFRSLAIDPMFECLKTLSTNKSSSSTTKPSNRHSLLLYNAPYGPLAPTDLLRRADENWTRSHPYSRFGPSYHTSLPSHWAQQLLGLNLTVTFHNHFRKRIRALQSRHSRNHPPPSRTQYTPRGRPFYTTRYTSRLRTMRTHQDL
jgi:hypothetical protein